MESDVPVTIGVDTHADFHVGVALDQKGGLVGELSLANDEGGYRRLLSWGRHFDELVCVGAEGTGSYGAGLSRFLRSEGVQVVEVNRVSRQHRRRRGKHDAGDAEATGEPKAADGYVEMLRALKIVRRSAVKAKTQAANQLHALVSTTPERLKADLCKLPAPRLAQKASRFRCDARPADPAAVDEVRLALGRSPLPRPPRGGDGAPRVDRVPGQGIVAPTGGAGWGGTRHRGAASGGRRGQPRATEE